jgi:hypothetical protein
MHRRHWFPRRVAQLVSTFYGDPNRDIAHVKGHHLDLDTPADSDTAYRGEIIYTFIFRASYGAYSEAIKGEAQRLRRLGLSPWSWRNRTYQEVALLALVPALCGYFAGNVAAGVAVASMVIAKALVETFNYFQHYGLQRMPGAPIGIQHAWNHMGAIARPIGVEITNHINHHLDGHTPFFVSVSSAASCSHLCGFPSSPSRAWQSGTASLPARPSASWPQRPIGARDGSERLPMIHIQARSFRCHRCFA